MLPFMYAFMHSDHQFKENIQVGRLVNKGEFGFGVFFGEKTAVNNENSMCLGRNESSTQTEVKSG